MDAVQNDNAHLGADEREFLNAEADHFFQAELNHEQRASWLLGSASGLLALVTGALVGSREGKIGTGGVGLLVAGASALALSILLALVALWPVSGHSATPWNPFRRLTTEILPYRGLTGAELARRHYAAHRHRAEIKGTRVARTLLALLAGVLLAFVGMLRSIL